MGQDVRRNTHSTPLNTSLGTAIYTTVIKLNPEKKVLEGLPYTFNSNNKNFFYLGKFYSLERKPTLPISKIEDEADY